MRKLLQLTFLACSFIFIVSCSSDDPEPPHIVGDWTLEAINATNLPDAYSAWEGQPFTSAGYDIEINNDGTFIERVKQSAGPTQVYTGKWELTSDDEEFVLDYDDFEDNSIYQVEKNELDQFWYTISVQYPFVSNSNLEKLEEDHGSISEGFDYLDALDPEVPEELAILEEFYQVVDFDMLYSLIRSE